MTALLRWGAFRKLWCTSSALHSLSALSRTYMAGSSFPCRVMAAPDEGSVREFLKQQFFKREPISERLGEFSQREMSYILDPFFHHVLNDGVSVIVDNPTSGQIVGVLLGLIETINDPKISAGPDVSGERRKANVILDILGKLSRGVDLYRLCKVDKLLHVLIVSVHSGEEGHGIAKMMVQSSEEAAMSKGVEVSFAEATGILSRKALEHLDYNILKELQYTVPTDKESQNKDVFCALAVKRLEK